MRHELGRPSRSASDQPATAKADCSCCRVPISTRLTGSPGNPSPVIVKRGTRLRWRILRPVEARRASTVCEAVPYVRAKAKIVGSLLSVNLKTKTTSQTLRMPSPAMSRRRTRRFSNLTIQPPYSDPSATLLLYSEPRRQPQSGRELIDPGGRLSRRCRRDILLSSSATVLRIKERTMRAGTIVAAVLAVAISGAAHAADTVKIGVIFPLTGNAASAGQSAKDAVTLAADIVNTAYPELKNLPLGATAGLPNLGGAKIELDEADHQGNPQVGQQQTVRLITQDHVAAMLGSYHSSVSLVATAVAERQGVPYLVADSVAANITGRGFKWTFRTTPFAPDFAKAYADFLNELKKSGRKIDSIAIVKENTDDGTSVSASVIDAAKTANIKVAAQIAYNANSSDVSAQVLQLKSLQPDVVIFISYTQDIILYFKTMKNLDYLPPMILGDDAGFSDPRFHPNVGHPPQGALNRSAFDIGKPGANSYIVNQMFKAKYGRDLDDTSARWMQGFFVLADAINRAGSIEPDKIQAALKATDLKPDQLMIGYNGVKFDETGQNTLSATYLIQLQGKEYVSVWPESRATAKLQWPMKGWGK